LEIRKSDESQGFDFEDEDELEDELEDGAGSEEEAAALL
jgi:hypothetical protein